jgi:hypothetical protein
MGKKYLSCVVEPNSTDNSLRVLQWSRLLLRQIISAVYLGIATRITEKGGRFRGKVAAPPAKRERTGSAAIAPDPR